MPMAKLRVVLRDPGGNEDIAGTLVVDDFEDDPFVLPAEFLIVAGTCKLEAACPGRLIQGENPRLVDVKVPTVYGAPPQKEIFDVL